MKKTYFIVIGLLLCLFTVIGITQETNTKNTLKLNHGHPQQKATINDIKWLTGDWVGTGFGNYSQEVWNKPSAHSMMGMFQMLKDGDVKFYEFFHIIEQDQSLLLEIKHFNPDLTGWETKDKKVQFRLIKIEGQTAWFDGLTYQRKDNQLTAWVAIEQDDGKLIEGEFVFHLD